LLILSVQRCEDVGGWAECRALCCSARVVAIDVRW
jgi:hypothetical protein